MKSLKDLSLNLTEEEYRELPCLSYSALSKYDRERYGAVATLFDKISSPSLTFGSAVDCMLTQGEQQFNEQYVVSEAATPSDTIVSIMTQLADSHNENSLILVSDEDLLLAADAAEYCMRFKPETRVKKLRDEGSQYYGFLKSSQGKTILSRTDYDDVVKAVETLKTNPVTSQYFVDTPLDSRERLFQLQFKSVLECTDIPYKGMLDLVIVDHKRKLIIPCDLKTTKSVYSFRDSFYKYRYYIQAAMYTKLLSDIKEQIPELRDYIISSYRFIAIDRTNFVPVVFDYAIPAGGIVVDPDGKTRKHWSELLQELTNDLGKLDTALPAVWAEAIKQQGFVNLNNL
jgi:hypothetical protein